MANFRIPYITKRLLAFLRADKEYAILFPFVVLHELSHYMFILMLQLKTGLRMEFKITADTIGFEFSEKDIADENAKVGLIGAIIFTLSSMAPIIPLLFLCRHLADILLWNQLVGIYVAFGLRLLIPSSDDCDSFLALPKHLFKKTDGQETKK